MKNSILKTLIYWSIWKPKPIADCYENLFYFLQMRLRRLIFKAANSNCRCHSCLELKKLADKTSPEWTNYEKLE